MGVAGEIVAPVAENPKGRRYSEWPEDRLRTLVLSTFSELAALSCLRIGCTLSIATAKRHDTPRVAQDASIK